MPEVQRTEAKLCHVGSDGQTHCVEPGPGYTNWFVKGIFYRMARAEGSEMSPEERLAAIAAVETELRRSNKDDELGRVKLRGRLAGLEASVPTTLDSADDEEWD